MKIKIVSRSLWCMIFLFCLVLTGKAQEEQARKEKISFRDSLDNNLDLSDIIINKKGFVPMPIIITEPALGGFGGGLAPVFIQPNKPKVIDGKTYPMPPDITAAFGGYTLNDTWMVGGGRVGTIRKWGLRYVIGAAYGNVNMDYYFNLERLNQDAQFEFNMKIIPIYVSLTKQLKDPRFTIGIQYLFMNTDLELKNSHNNSKWISQLDKKIEDQLSGNVANLGLKLAFDDRDNIFTPNKGLKVYFTGQWSNPVVGSDYKYGLFEGASYYYFPLRHNLITGTRLDMQQSVGNQPFYIKPFIDMRGVPTARYQGKTTMLAELEERWDFTPRWSLVAFGGLGKAFDNYSDFKDVDTAWSYGGGFRYLMARKLNLRMGVDFANGPEGFAYYLVFGSSWLRQ